MPSLIARKFLLTKPDYNNELVEKEIEKMSEKKLKKYMFLSFVSKHGQNLVDLGTFFFY